MGEQSDIAQYVAALLKTHDGGVRSTIQDCFVGSGKQLSGFIRAVNEAIATSSTEDTLRLFESTATEAFGSDAHDKGFLDKARVLTYLLLGVRGRNSVPAFAAPLSSTLNKVALTAAARSSTPSMSDLQVRYRTVPFTGLLRLL